MEFLRPIYTLLDTQVLRATAASPVAMVIPRKTQLHLIWVVNLPTVSMDNRKGYRTPELLCQKYSVVFMTVLGQLQRR